jgi:hypothetical protein
MQRLSGKKQSWLLAPQTGPCVTIYVDLLDLHDATRKYSAFLHEAQRLIERSQPDAIPGAFMRPLVDFLSEFPGLEGLEGVAVFRSRSTAGYIPLYAKTPTEVIVADSFHVEPVLSLLQESQKYQVLALGERSAKLFLATHTTLERLETFAVEAEPAPGETPVWSHATHGLWRLQLPAQGEDARREHLLRLLQTKIRPGIEHSGHPLILIGQPNLVQAYRRINAYPATIEREIAHDPTAISELGLHDEIEALLREIASQHDFDLVNEYLDRYEEGDATDSVEHISKLVRDGQVQTLLVERGRKLWGMFDRRSGRLETHAAQRNARDGDVLDDFSQMVVSSGGSVVVLDPHFMPSASPVAAIFKRAQAA